jgi:hypothetical protein
MATNYTLAELQDLEAALAAGITRVTHNNVTTEFRSRDDLLKQISVMRRELGLPPDEVTRTSPRIKRLRWVTSKGLWR